MTRDEQRALGQALCLMNVRECVDAGVRQFEGKFPGVRVVNLPGPESDIAATVWVKIREALTDALERSQS